MAHLKKSQHLWTLYRISHYLVIGGLVLFTVIDYPVFIIDTPSLTFELLEVSLLNPLALLYVPGLCLMLLGGLLGQYSSRQLGFKNHFNRFRLLALLAITLAANLGYNWFFIHYL